MPYPQLLQEKYCDDPWKMLVCCVLLNQTTRAQVDSVEEKLFEQWPDPESLAVADLTDLYETIKSTGFGWVKSDRLKKLSRSWAEFVVDEMRLPTANEVMSLPGCGRYAVDSYRVFVDRQHVHSSAVTDKEIKAYLERREDGGT